MIKLIPALFLIGVCSLPVGVAYPADASDATVRIAAISALDPAAPPKAPARAVAPYFFPTRGALDLRFADLRSIQVQDPQQVTTPANSDQERAHVIVTAPLLLEERSDTHLSLAGIGSLYWAARHLTQAWRVLLPIQPRDGSDITADIRARCAVFAESPSGRDVGCYFDTPVKVIR